MKILRRNRRWRALGLCPIALWAMTVTVLAASPASDIREARLSNEDTIFQELVDFLKISTRITTVNR
jgi:hypothetical protein